MNYETLTEFKDYLRDAGAETLPPSDIPEELAPDLPIATFASTANKIIQFELSPFSDQEPVFQFFVDGVQRTVTAKQVTVNSVRIPIHLAHLIAGAMERVDGSLQPSFCRQALVVIFPYQALGLADSSWSTRHPPGSELSSEGRIYDLICRGGNLYSDSSIKLQIERGTRRPIIELQSGDLIRTGELRQKALNRSKELLRIMEVGVVNELRQKFPCCHCIVDMC